MESQLEKEARFCQLMAHSSHDSAIDTDSLEWETEVVEFEKDRVREVIASYHQGRFLQRVSVLKAKRTLKTKPDDMNKFVMNLVTFILLPLTGRHGFEGTGV